MDIVFVIRMTGDGLIITIELLGVVHRHRHIAQGRTIDIVTAKDATGDRNGIIVFRWVLDILHKSCSVSAVTQSHTYITIDDG